MEFQNTSTEKSWKFFLSSMRIIQKKFALHVLMMIMNFFIFCGKGFTKRGDVEATVRKVK